MNNWVPPKTETFHILFPHGLGDAILATPALRRFSEENPHYTIVIHGLSRHGAAFPTLFKGSPYAARNDLPDPWHDFPSYQDGIAWMEGIARERVKSGGKAIVLPCAMHDEIGGDNPEHKIYRFAFELGVEVDDPSLDIWCDRDLVDKMRERFASRFSGKRTVFFHVDAGDPIKTISPGHALFLAKRHIGDDFVSIVVQQSVDTSAWSDDPSMVHRVWSENIQVSFAALAASDDVCVIDSVMMHAAAAMGKPQVAWFGREEIIEHVKPLVSPVLILGSEGYYERREGERRPI